MAASREQIRQVVDRYVELVGSGTADEIVALYAEDAVVEDPVGSEPRVGHAAIRELYATLEGLDQRTRLLAVRIAGGEAAFHFEVATLADGVTYTLAPVDVMVFDDGGSITSMRAYWGEEDMTIG
ncbi:nuclear transport factor 2 family protein [Nocardioides sp. T2.26MG-1]|uniref:nuclear transport factor 2 family protein n=1 Tax=Nocardioides sp. T2.26MG-1 TaxID=3041166 RepID=UPI002477B8F8|nr:nuclear transport factor 2 family protein [Nocardioides sp. T2.26MG-1]CAI9416940.1 Steroid Delta-isomerase [Nocardioides sp. T2.26MG-1]